MKIHPGHFAMLLISTFCLAFGLANAGDERGWGGLVLLSIFIIIGCAISMVFGDGDDS